MELAENPFEKSNLVLRLERNQREARQLKNKLSSYLCEPRTYNLFERSETLKSGLERLSDTNDEIIQALREKKKSVEEYMESVKQQFTMFHELQQGVQDYVQGMRS
ncbi:MAG: hypothetical protein WBM83_03825 [Flavobacteriaceae bacterium]